MGKFLLSLLFFKCELVEAILVVNIELYFLVGPLAKTHYASFVELHDACFSQKLSARGTIEPNRLLEQLD